MGQTRILARTFFTRLFESDLMPDGLPQVQLVVWGTILAAAPVSAYAFYAADKYAFIRFSQALAPEFDADRMVLLTLSMMTVGIVSLLIWDGVFPDRRDARVLGCLPIPVRAFVAARLIALSQVFLFFAGPMCVLQSLVFPMTVAGFGDPIDRITGIAAHFASVVLGSIFVFAGLIAVQCVVLVSFGRRLSQDVSTAFQLLFAVGIVQLLVFLPDIGRVLRTGGIAHEGLESLAALPPVWFFGVYEHLAGSATETTTSLGWIGLAAAPAALVSAIALYAASYNALTRRALEGAPLRPNRPTRDRVVAMLRRLPASRFDVPVRAAIRRFAMETFARSRYHRMMLSMYAGIALALAFSSGASVAFVDGLWTPSVAMLSMPLIVQFLVLIGMRVIVAIPTEPRARWLFRLCEPARPAIALAGARDAMLLMVVLPSSLFAFAHGAIFWSVDAGLRHALFCAVVGTALSELLLVGLDKLPFACTYFPGKSRVFTLWPLYVAAFFFYTAFLAVLDFLFLTRLRALLIFCALAIAATALLAARHRRLLATLPGLRFEEEDPDLMFQGFNLSEAIAAAPRPIATHEHEAPTRS